MKNGNKKLCLAYFYCKRVNTSTRIAKIFDGLTRDYFASRPTKWPPSARSFVFNPSNIFAILHLYVLVLAHYSKNIPHKSFCCYFLLNFHKTITKI